MIGQSLSDRAAGRTGQRPSSPRPNLARRGKSNRASRLAFGASLQFHCGGRTDGSHPSEPDGL